MTLLGVWVLIDDGLELGDGKKLLTPVKHSMAVGANQG